MRTRWLSVLSAGLLLALAAPLAAQDAAHAQALADAGDFAGARAELASPQLRDDPDALMLAARLSRDGAGAPADPLAAYRDYTLVFMLGDPDLRVEAAYERAGVAGDLSPARIRAAEKLAIDWLDAGMGAEARVAAVQDLVTTLKACIATRSSCDNAVWMTFDLGPAAAPAVPHFERMMTVDPMWIARVDYVNSLTAIGTAAVPALCNIMLDRQQFDAEGPWNAKSAAEGLELLGPTAREALPCLVQGLTASYGPIPDLTADLGESLGSTPEGMMLALRMSMASAIIVIGDPEQAVHDSLADAAARQTGDTTLRIILSWILGMTYQEPGAAIAIAPAVFASTGSEPGPGSDATWMMLNVLLDLSSAPGFVEQAQGLIPQLRDLKLTGPADLGELTEALISAVTGSD